MDSNNTKDTMTTQEPETSGQPVPQESPAEGSVPRPGFGGWLAAHKVMVGIAAAILAVAFGGAVALGAGWLPVGGQTEIKTEAPAETGSQAELSGEDMEAIYLYEHNELRGELMGQSLLDSLWASLEAQYSTEELPEETTEETTAETMALEEGLLEVTLPPMVRASDKLARAITILQHLEEHSVIGTVTTVDVSKITDLQLSYEDRYQVLLGDDSNMSYKIRSMKEAVRQMPDYQSGTLDVSFTAWPDKAVLTPFPEEES